jgi:hypothetical protein
MIPAMIVAASTVAIVAIAVVIVVALIALIYIVPRGGPTASVGELHPILGFACLSS